MPAWLAVALIVASTGIAAVVFVISSRREARKK